MEPITDDFSKEEDKKLISLYFELELSTTSVNSIDTNWILKNSNLSYIGNKTFLCVIININNQTISTLKI